VKTFSLERKEVRGMAEGLASISEGLPVKEGISGCYPTLQARNRTSGLEHRGPPKRNYAIV
jgi:hypothetical protein